LEYKNDIPVDFQSCFVPNNEAGKEYLVIDKSRAASRTFWETSELIWTKIKEFYSILQFPMLEDTLQKTQGILLDKIVLIASKQNPPHNQDCYYVAKILEYHLERKNLDSQVLPFEFPPTNFDALVEFFTELFLDTKKQFESVWISNSGGTPDMRSASHFAGIFQGFQYITINSTDRSNNQTFVRQEGIILRQIVQSMLNVYDYEGIIQLPLNHHYVKSLAEYCIHRIALNFKLAAKSMQSYKESDSFANLLCSELEKVYNLKELETEMYFSAKVRYFQKSYADYLWRLFTIHDNMLVPYVEQILGAPVVYNKKTNFQEWKNALARVDGLVDFLSTKTKNGEPLDIGYPNKSAFMFIIDFRNPKNSKERPAHIDNMDKCLNQLSDLRNIVAHSFGFNAQKKLDGVGLDEIEAALPKKFRGVEKFNHLLSDYIGIEWDDMGVYARINNKILESMN
jgi:hypothetical protein